VRRGWLESWPTRTRTALLVVCLNLRWCREARVWCVPFTLKRGVSLCLGEPPHREGGRRVGFRRGEFVGRSFARGQYEYGGNDRSFRSQRSYEPRSSLHGLRSHPRGRVGVLPRRDRMDCANPTFEKMARHWFNSFCTNLSVESFSHSRSHF
jgi:hypothetical protein